MQDELDIIIAIVPRIQDDFGYTPAGPALLKGSLKAAGFSSKILDFNADIDNRFSAHPDRIAVDNFFLFNGFYNQRIWSLVMPLFEEWSDKILAMKPKWVGISIFSYNSHRAARLLCIALKKQQPEIKIVIGGGGIATDKTFPQNLLQHGIVDAYIRGEGEKALIDLLNGDVEAPGINGKEPQQIINVDDLAFPDYDDYELKSYTNRKGLEALPITGSRGCVRACTFCDIANMWPRYYYRSGKNIAREIRHQVEKYSVGAFRFTDSLINGSMKAFREMINELAAYRKSLPVDRRFIWDTHFIVRSRSQMPPEDFDMMARAGAGTMLIGIESGSAKVRDHMRKGFTQEDLDYTMSQLDRVGVKCRMLMIVGYPTETLDDFQQTLDMFTRYVPYLERGIIEEVNLGLTLNLIPGTPLDKEKDQIGLIQKNDHINDWICIDNPSLTYKERIRRRIILQAHCERLGYKIFEAKNYTKQLLTAWKEVCSMQSTSDTLIRDIRYDPEKKTLVAEVFS
jgi:radical SAM superfamily enzyme YgiQ (UPF0313 family)